KSPDSPLCQPLDRRSGAQRSRERALPTCVMHPATPPLKQKRDCAPIARARLDQPEGSEFAVPLRFGAGVRFVGTSDRRGREQALPEATGVRAARLHATLESSLAPAEKCDEHHG